MYKRINIKLSVPMAALIAAIVLFLVFIMAGHPAKADETTDANGLIEDISKATDKKMTDEEISVHDARYEKKDDGIWHLKKVPSLERLYKNIKIGLRYPIGLKRSGNNEFDLYTVKSGSIRFMKSVRETAEKDLGAKAVCMFVGDLMCLKGQQYAAEAKGGYDFYPMYSTVEPVFKTADFVCGNLETLLSDSNPLTKDQLTASNGQPQCNGPVVYLNALRKAGFDMVVTANNHTCDWGATGITETKTHLDEYGFANVGTHYYKKDEKKAGERFSIFDVNGINIAVLSYTHLINQRGYLSSSEMSVMVHAFNRDTVKADIAAAKERGADFVVVYCHWGIENTEELNSTQTGDAKFLADNGADLIIGSHPHCLQRCEYIRSESGKKVLCMYSMGNFCSSMARDINNDTIILRVVVERRNGKTDMGYHMGEASYIPCRVAVKNGKSWVVVPTSSKLNGGTSNGDLKAAETRIDKIMNNVIPKYNKT